MHVCYAVHTVLWTDRFAVPQISVGTVESPAYVDELAKKISVRPLSPSRKGRVRAGIFDESVEDRCDIP